jgi:hypothetical protein
MNISRAAAAALGLAFITTALAGASAQAAPAPVPTAINYAATITMDFSMDALEPVATPGEVTVAIGDVVKVTNKISEGAGSEGVYIALVNGSGVARVGAKSCTMATPCKVVDDFPNNPFANVTAVAVGTVKILRYNSNVGSRPTYLGRIVIQQEKTIEITGGRKTVAGWSGMRIAGTTVGFRLGAEVVPFVKLVGQDSYTAGTVTAVVKKDGSFIWERPGFKRAYVYFQSANGDTKSNRITIEGR